MNPLLFITKEINKLTTNLTSTVIGPRRILEPILTGKGTLSSFNNGLKPGGGL